MLSLSYIPQESPALTGPADGGGDTRTLNLRPAARVNVRRARVRTRIDVAGGGRRDSNPDPVSRSESQITLSSSARASVGSDRGQGFERGPYSPRLPVPPCPPECPAPAVPCGDAVVPATGRRRFPVSDSEALVILPDGRQDRPAPQLAEARPLLTAGSISRKKNEGLRGPGRSSRTIQSCAQESGRASHE